MTPLDYPSEYLDGSVRFFWRDFVVTPAVLIPRLETEVLVRRARRWLSTHRPAFLIELGVGSGCIMGSLLDLVPDETQCFALDRSPEALEIAERNISHHHEKQVEYLKSDLFSRLILDPWLLNQEGLIVANLPYVRDHDLEHMSPDTQYEPALALFGGAETGFELYDRWFAELAGLGLTATTLIIEYGYNQSSLVRSACLSYGWSEEGFTDYAGIPRFSEISLWSEGSRKNEEKNLHFSRLSL